MTCQICDQKPANCDCTKTERRQFAKIAELNNEISRMKMQSATEALAWSLGQMWVSADEQLPDDRTYCLVIASDDDSAVGHYELANYTKQYGWAFSDDSIDRFYMKVTHWMPLPEPPNCATH